MAERLQNLRRTRSVERTRHNQRTQYPADSSYRGSHRARQAEDQRSSRVGHHHTRDPRRAPASRW